MHYYSVYQRVANYVSNTTSVLLGNEDGTFQNPTNYIVLGFPAGLTADTFTNSKKLDLVL